MFRVEKSASGNQREKETADWATSQKQPAI
jgi:hypothetical protein